MAGAARPPEPQFEILLQISSLRPNETVPLDLWIANPSLEPLHDVRVVFMLPPFMEVVLPSATTRPLTGDLVVGEIPGGQFRHYPLRLQVHSEIFEGKTQLGFELRYGLHREGLSRSTAYILHKELIETSIFGTDTVAGVPLSLLVLLVPGVIFLVLLRVLGEPGIDRLSSVEVNTLIVTYSIILLVIFSGSNRMISIGSLACYLVASMFMSALLAYIWYLLKVWRLHLIIDTDSDATALLKAFRTKSNKGPVQVELRNGATLVGAMAARTVDGYALFGWFTVNAEKTREKLLTLEKDGKYFELMQTVIDSKDATIDIEDSVQMSDEEGKLSGTGTWVQRIAKGDIKSGPVPVNKSSYQEFDLKRMPVVVG